MWRMDTNDMSFYNAINTRFHVCLYFVLCVETCSHLLSCGFYSLSCSKLEVSINHLVFWSLHLHRSAQITLTKHNCCNFTLGSLILLWSSFFWFLHFGSSQKEAVSLTKLGWKGSERFLVTKQHFVPVKKTYRVALRNSCEVQPRLDNLFQYLAQAFTASCICEIPCLSTGWVRSL